MLLNRIRTLKYDSWALENNRHIKIAPSFAQKNDSIAARWSTSQLLSKGVFLYKLLRCHSTTENPVDSFWCKPWTALCTLIIITNWHVLPQMERISSPNSFQSEHLKKYGNFFFWARQTILTWTGANGSGMLIGDFPVAFRFCFKASPRAKPFISKLVLFTRKFWFIYMWIKPISVWKASH